LKVGNEDLFESFVTMRREHHSILSWVEKKDWHSKRNKREGSAWGRVIDSMFAEGIGATSRALGFAMRRLTGVHLADQFGDWNACDVLEQHSPGDSPLNIKQIGSILKQAQRVSKFRGPSSTKPTRGGKSWPAKGKKKFDEKKSSAPSASGGSGASGK
jgi:hypothetical protein